MARPALTDTLSRIAEPVVASFGLEIWGMEVLQSGRTVIRLFVDVPLDTEPSAEVHADESGELVSENGPRPSASIDQCARISRMIGLALDVEDIINDAYVLEVSSPGLTRRFFHLAQLGPYVGDMLEVVLNEFQPAWPNRKRFVGTLQAVTDTDFSLLPAPLDTEAAPEATAPKKGKKAVAAELPVQPEHKEEAQLLTATWEEVRKIQRVHVFHDPVKPGKKRADAK